MATVEWQTTCTDLKQRGSMLLKTEEWMDCTILVGPEAVPFRAHKLMLSMASPVFESMFFVETAQDQDIFTVPDVDATSFEALVNYIYTENINVSSYKQAHKLYFAANKFIIPQLAMVCAEFMCSNVSMETACSMYEVGHKFQDHLLMSESLQMIKSNIREILQHESFFQADIETVAAIFGIPDLMVEETELFQVLERYLLRNSSRKRIASSAGDQSGHDSISPRSVRKALQNIRFLTFSLEQFAKGPAMSGLLTPADSLALMVNIAGGQAEMPPGFTDSRQHRYQRAPTPQPTPTTSGVLRTAVTYIVTGVNSSWSDKAVIAGRSWQLRVVPRLECSTFGDVTRYLAVFLRFSDTSSSVVTARVTLLLLTSGGTNNASRPNEHRSTTIEKNFSKSDSEYYYEKKGRSANPEKQKAFESDDEVAFIRKRTKESGPKRNSKHSDDETASVRGKKKEPKASTSAKRKRPSSSKKQPDEPWRALDSESEDEEVCKRAKGALRSSYSKRVADGTVRRTAQLDGELFVDLKLYQVADIKDVPLAKRYEKAVLQLKYQTDHDAPELTLLHQFLKRCKSQFREEGWFFADESSEKKDAKAT